MKTSEIGKQFNYGCCPWLKIVRTRVNKQKKVLSSVEESGALFSKVRKTFRARPKPADSEELDFSVFIIGCNIKIAVKFRISKRLRFEDTKRIM